MTVESPPKSPKRRRKPVAGAQDRPTIIDNETGQRIFELMAGGASLRKIAQLDGMPTFQSIARWAIQNATNGVAAQYALASQLRCEYWAEEIIDISDEAKDKDSAFAARVKIEARKWLLSKLLPHKYGNFVGLPSGLGAGLTVVIGSFPGQAPAAPRYVDSHTEAPALPAPDGE